MTRADKEISYLKRLGGRVVPVVRIPGTDNIEIGGKGFKKMIVMATGNTGVGARTIVKARKFLIKKKLQ